MAMHRVHRAVLVVVLCLGRAVVLAAEDSSESQSEAAPAADRLEEIVVTATRVPVAPDESPTALTVLRREQIDQKQVRTVADALREVPGVHVVRTGQPGAVTTVFLRGANSEHTLVLIDGVRVNNAFNTQFDFANLSVDHVERIEVLRGPQSTLYGSEAIGGVINIVTRRDAPRPTGSVLVEGGQNDSLRARGAFAMRDGKLGLAGETSYFTTDNERINSDLFAWNASGRISYDALERLRVSFHARYLQSEAGAPGSRFANDPNDLLRTENSLFALSFDADPADWWNARLTLSRAHERSRFEAPEPNPPFFFGGFESGVVADRDQLDFQNIFTFDEMHRIMVGGTFDRSEADFESTFSAFRRDASSKSGYAQYEFSPVEAFTFTAGGRVDDFSSFGTHGTYRFGGRYTVPQCGAILRANVGTGFRAPSLRDLFFPGFSNPDLKPEKSLGWDVGVEQPLAGDKLRLGVTYFHNEYDDLIISQFPADPPLANVGKAKSFGIESFVVWVPTPELTLRAAYTWMDAENRLTNQRLLRRPEHAGNFYAHYRFLQRFGAHANVNIVGKRPDFGGTTAAGYVTADVGLSVELTRWFELFGRVENLFDKDYEEVFGFPALGRTFWVGGLAKF
jgi:vitamin B12 transporter